jgi:SAM-dependent methyltransferase
VRSAVSDLQARVKSMKRTMNLGCGEFLKQGMVNVDVEDYADGKHTFVKADFNKRLPFDDCSFDEVVMERSLEHASDIVFTLAEVRRVLKMDGVLKLVVPYWRFRDAFAVDHKYFFTYQSFGEREHGFLRMERRICFFTHKKVLERLTAPLEFVVNKWMPNLYEMSVLSVLIPAPEMRFTFKRIG